jgi:phosphate:Na+ symporter
VEHSSVASVLLLMSLGLCAFLLAAGGPGASARRPSRQRRQPDFQGARRNHPASYRLPLGNLVNRLAGVVLVAPFLNPISDLQGSWQPDLAKATALFHIAFDVAAAVIFIGLRDGLARLVKRLLTRVFEADAARPRYLDDSAFDRGVDASCPPWMRSTRMRVLASRSRPAWVVSIEGSPSMQHRCTNP